MDRLIEEIIYFGQLIDILCIICTIIGCFGGVILNNRDDGPNSKNKVRRFLLWMLAIVSLVILALNKFWIPNLTKVPEIENCVLDTAKIMLSQRELSYVITNAYEYQDQDPLLYKVSLNNNEANTYTKKGTAVELKIIGIEKVDVYDDSVDWDSLKVRAPGEVEIDPNIQRVDLCVDLRECVLNEISVGGGFTPSLTRKIENEPKRMYLFDVDNIIMYKIYEKDTSKEDILDYSYVFKNIPYGKYVFLIEEEGFFKERYEIRINGDDVENGKKHVSVLLERMEEEKDLYFSMVVMNEKHEPIKGVICDLYKDGDEIKHEYRTNEDGMVFENGFIAKEGTEFNMDVSMERSASVNNSVRVMVKNEDTILIILNEDGTIRVTDAATEYNY